MSWLQGCRRRGSTMFSAMRTIQRALFAFVRIQSSSLPNSELRFPECNVLDTRLKQFGQIRLFNVLTGNSAIFIRYAAPCALPGCERVREKTDIFEPFRCAHTALRSDTYRRAYLSEITGNALSQTQTRPTTHLATPEFGEGQADPRSAAQYSVPKP